MKLITYKKFSSFLMTKLFFLFLLSFIQQDLLLFKLEAPEVEGTLLSENKDTSITRDDNEVAAGQEREFLSSIVYDGIKRRNHEKSVIFNNHHHLHHHHNHHSSKNKLKTRNDKKKHPHQRSLGSRREGNFVDEKLINNWCNYNCENEEEQEEANGIVSPLTTESSSFICGSDGKLYKSICGLKREACLKNIHLFKRDKSHCLNGKFLQINKELDEPDYGENTVDDDDVEKKKFSEKKELDGKSSNIVRIVELKKKCNLKELNEMKLMLLKEFNGDIELMFNYFDTNKDKSIEAHELWPNKNIETNKLLYAQLWDKHSKRCKLFKERTKRHDLKYFHSNLNRYEDLVNQDDIMLSKRNTNNDDDDDNDDSKCWFYLDFPFEPQFPKTTNPCSLSHLMIFDDSMLNVKSDFFKFNLESFQEAFSLAKERFDREKIKLQEPIKKFTYVTMNLGDSQTFSCLNNVKKPKTKSKLANQNDLEENNNNKQDQNENKSQAMSFKEVCVWSRYNTNLATIKDPHLELNNDDDEEEEEDFKLSLKDAQLYLSGQYKCHCQFMSGSSRKKPYEHYLNIQVLAKPRVEIRPKFQWSLPSSRISFECLYDYIDTMTIMRPSSNERGQPEQKKISTAHQEEEEQNTTTNNKDDDEISSKQEDNASGAHSASKPNEERQEEASKDDDVGQFGLRVRWFNGQGELIKDRKRFQQQQQQSEMSSTTTSPTMDNDEGDWKERDDIRELDSDDDNNKDEEEEEVRTGNSDTDSNEQDESGNSIIKGKNGAKKFFPISFSVREAENETKTKAPLVSASVMSARASITMASSRLILEDLKLEDSCELTCRVEPVSSNLQIALSSNANNNNNNDNDDDDDDGKTVNKSSSSSTSSFTSDSVHLDGEIISKTGLDDRRAPTIMMMMGQDKAKLLVQEQLPNISSNFSLGSPSPSGEEAYPSNLPYSSSQDNNNNNYLWMFHENGISIFRLPNDDGQEMELLKEINGHSLVNAEVDGNWNQLTLCGGLNSEQAVICEWSDNAIEIKLDDMENYDQAPSGEGAKTRTRRRRRYVYVGQPNLNRIIIMEGDVFEIVAIINTEPQPRKLSLYKPSKIHLSKWVRRRLSPIANMRWLNAGISQGKAHPLNSTPNNSKLYVDRTNATGSNSNPSLEKQTRDNLKYSPSSMRSRRSFSSSSSLLHPQIQQLDIWLLCYGQPLVVSPAGETFDDFNPFTSNTNGQSQQQQQQLQLQSNQTTSINNNPFTPRLASSYWPNVGRNNVDRSSIRNIHNNNFEAKLRNRKSVHIIQSTFLPLIKSNSNHHHHHHSTDYDHDHNQAADNSQQQQQQQRRHSRQTKNLTIVGQFQHSTVLTTHHIYSSSNSNGNGNNDKYSRNLDLIQDLIVPSKPFSLELNEKHKIHYAYVTHYNEQSLFRINMDEYNYDKEIDLNDCDPINLITTAQGLIIVQCRSLITHNLIGQLVLDQLTTTKIEFNANTKAQESYLSPDNRYLISIYTSKDTSTNDNSNKSRIRSTKCNASSSTSTTTITNKNTSQQETNCTSNHNNNKEQQRQSIIYVQLVNVNGLKLQYKVKTLLLEIRQCSFVWKDGYYAAIFVSSNFKDQQSELLSLRLADSRLELIARVPGLISPLRHKDQLIVNSELRLAALTTNQGTFVVDLEENRVSQTLRRHQSPPTLLWA